MNASGYHLITPVRREITSIYNQPYPQPPIGKGRAGVISG